MTRFAHCNRIFAVSPQCSGVVSHELLDVLIAASPVQHAEAVLVGLALRCQDATATRNIPQVARSTAVIASIWKRALVNKLTAMACSPMCVRRSLESTANGAREDEGKSMLCIRFEDTCRGRCIVVLPSYGVADIGKSVRLSRDPALGLLCLIKHLRCYLCRERRLATSQACAPAYRRRASSVSSATWAVLGCRVASSPSDEERSVSLGFSTSAAVNCASTCDSCCRVVDGRSMFLSKRTQANDMGSHTYRASLDL